MKLSDKDILNICEEIELQWEYHLMSRAIFYSRFPEKDEYNSPQFYKNHGIDFSVKLPRVKSKTFERAAQGIGIWLNQNYVIRLFGILDSKGIIAYGIENNLKVIKLIKILRNNIGAHSSGRNVSRKKELKDATKLINELFGRTIPIEQVEYYTLSVDSVLLPMKNQAITVVKALRS